MTQSKYPLHEQLRARHQESLILSGFLDFIREQGWKLAEFTEASDYMFPIRQRPDEIIGLYMGIDSKGLSAEKDAMIEEIRAVQP